MVINNFPNAVLQKFDTLRSQVCAEDIWLLKIKSKQIKIDLFMILFLQGLNTCGKLLIFGFKTKQDFDYFIMY